MSKSRDTSCKAGDTVKRQVETLDAAVSIFRNAARTGVLGTEIGTLQTAAQILQGQASALELRNPDAGESISRYRKAAVAIHRAAESKQFVLDDATLNEIRELTREHRKTHGIVASACNGEAASKKNTLARQ